MYFGLFALFCTTFSWCSDVLNSGIVRWMSCCLKLRCTKRKETVRECRSSPSLTVMAFLMNTTVTKILSHSTE